MRIRTPLPASAAAALALAAVQLVAAEEFVVGQKDKAFSVPRLEIAVGDTVSFRNDDPFLHNIFSLSKAQSFDLGTFPQGQARRVVFDKPGRVEIECAIHPEMKLRVEVRPRGAGRTAAGH